MSPEPFVLRWGIVATGGISTTFTKDLLLDPSVRGTTDVKHVLTAVGSRTVESAEKFIANVCPDKDLAAKVQPFASYQGVYDCPEVDAVYIGTPHTYHYDNTKDALNAGKHVLCEKPFTFDSAELEELLALAKEKKLFLMEAVWTRFQPIVKPLQEEVFGGKYGKLKRMFADLSFDMKPEALPDNHRIIDPALGGGALLDLGPYPMVWTMLLMHQNPLNKGRKPPSGISTRMSLLKRSGVDETTTWVVEWEGVGQSICTSSISIVGSGQPSVILQMETAHIHVAFPTHAPESYTIFRHRTSEDQPHPEGEVKRFPIHHGRGMHYQADSVARCIRDGKLECELCDHEESRIVMKTFDVVREQGGYVVKEGKASKKVL